MRSRSCSWLPKAARTALALAAAVTAGCGGGTGSSAPPQAPAAPGSGNAALPGEANPDLAAARVAIDEGRLEDARKLLEGIPASDPAYLLSQRQLGVVLLRMDRIDDAYDTYLRLSRLDSASPDVFVGLSWAQYRLGHPAEAELSSLRALELSPDSVPTRYNVALFRLAQGHLPQAIEAYHRAMNRDSTEEYVERARQHLVEMTEERPEFPDPHYALAYIANSLGDRDEEVRELERYLSYSPEGPAVAVARARLEEARRATRAK